MQQQVAIGKNYSCFPICTYLASYLPALPLTSYSRVNHINSHYLIEVVSNYIFKCLRNQAFSQKSQKNIGIDLAESIGNRKVSQKGVFEHEKKCSLFSRSRYPHLKRSSLRYNAYLAYNYIGSNKISHLFYDKPELRTLMRFASKIDHSSRYLFSVTEMLRSRVERQTWQEQDWLHGIVAWRDTPIVPSRRSQQLLRFIRAEDVTFLGRRGRMT